MPGQTCPRCSVSTISPRTGKCELCGFAPGAGVAIAAEDVVTAAAVRELAHEFEFGELLGRNSASAVHRVKERTNGRTAILKVIARRSDIPDAEESFRAMLGTFVGFEHPHLVPIIRFGSTDSLFWYTSEDVGATTLRSLIDERGTLDARTVRRIATQVVAALDYLHRHGVVHGAIKVDNILLDTQGWVRVADPTFLRPRWKRRTRTAPVRGTAAVGSGAPSTRPSWIAPEDHERGERLPAADQYALGALLYECVAGFPPEDPVESLMTVAPGLPPAMARAIETALSPEPFKRFPSCAEFVFALESGSASGSMAAVASRQSGQSLTPATGRPAERPSQDVVMIRGWEPPEEAKRPLLLVARIGGVVLVAAALWWSAPSLMRIIFPPAAPVVSAPTPPLAPRAEAPESQSTREARPAAPVAAVPPRVTPRSDPSSSPAPARPQTTRTTPQQAPPPAAAPSAEPARLFINATPWGLLYVDGVLLGNTPKANIELAPGQHTIRVARDGFEPFERTVQLRAGETLRLTDIVLTAVRP